MTSKIAIGAGIILLSIVDILAFEFYQTVKGNCNDLHVDENYDVHKEASGQWYHQYASYDPEEGRCVIEQIIERKNKLYDNMMIFNPKTNTYFVLPEDVTFLPGKNRIYTSEDGAIGRILAANADSYYYYIQCLNEEGRTKVAVVFATRGREADIKAEAVFKKYSAILVKKDLLPKMLKINQTDCPPV